MADDLPEGYLYQFDLPPTRDGVEQRVRVWTDERGYVVFGREVRVPGSSDPSWRLPVFGPGFAVPGDWVDEVAAALEAAKGRRVSRVPSD